MSPRWSSRTQVVSASCGGILLLKETLLSSVAYGSIELYVLVSVSLLCTTRLLLTLWAVFWSE